MPRRKDDLVLQDVIVHYMLSFKHLCLVTVLCPLAALFVCFVTAYVFQYDDIHETHCRVSCGGIGEEVGALVLVVGLQRDSFD